MMEAILHQFGMIEPWDKPPCSTDAGLRQIFPSLSALQLRHWVLGLEIYTDLTADMQPSIGPSMSRR